jgi:hypothetical protein
LDIIDQYTNKGVNVIENGSLENSGNYFAFLWRILSVDMVGIQSGP